MILKTTQVIKPTCGKRHFGKCLVDTGGCFGCVKDGYNVRYCPTIAAREREAKKVPLNTLDCGPQRVIASMFSNLKHVRMRMTVSYSFLYYVVIGVGKYGE